MNDKKSLVTYNGSHMLCYICNRMLSTMYHDISISFLHITYHFTSYVLIGINITHLLQCVKIYKLTTIGSALSWLVLQSGTARVVPAVARPLAAAPAGTTSAVPDCSTNHDSADRISGQFLFYHNQDFTKSKGNLRLRRLVPLFIRIGVCITTHDDGIDSDVTIGMWVTINRPRTTSAKANLGFLFQSSVAM